MERQISFGGSNIKVELVKKTKKQEPKVFPALMLVDKEAFESAGQTNTRFIMKEFWKSQNNRILVARKENTQAIVGYAIFSVCDLKDKRFGNKRVPSVYLLRIGVRINSQRQGIGRKLMNYLLENYPKHALSLDVSTDNDKAVKFYRKNGLKIQQIYCTPEDNVEFALFETPLDKKGAKICEENSNTTSEVVQPYFDDIDEFKDFESGKTNSYKKTEETKIDLNKSDFDNDEDTKSSVHSAFNDDVNEVALLSPVIIKETEIISQGGQMQC